MVESIIKANNLKSKLSTSCIVWSGSIEDKWNNITREIHIFLDNSFFIGYQNEYNRDCGWYVKFIELKPLIDNLYNGIIRQRDYKTQAQMLSRYYIIIDCINLEVNEFEKSNTAKKCNNSFCAYNIASVCCSLNQEKVEVDSLDCLQAVRVDYYDGLCIFRHHAKNIIESMDLNELQEFINRK